MLGILQSQLTRGGKRKTGWFAEANERRAVEFPEQHPHEKKSLKKNYRLQVVNKTLLLTKQNPIFFFWRWLQQNIETEVKKKKKSPRIILVKSSKKSNKLKNPIYPIKKTTPILCLCSKVTNSNSTFKGRKKGERTAFLFTDFDCNFDCN